MVCEPPTCDHSLFDFLTERTQRYPHVAGRTERVQQLHSICMTLEKVLNLLNLSPLI